MAGQRQTASPASQISVEDALQDQFEWLRHQAEGDKPAVKRKALHHIEDAGQTEGRTQTDYVGRFAVELLQNAHDACADADGSDGQGAVRFVLTESALLVANEGVAFDGPRIVSLVRQGSSEKAERVGRRTIGYKGVGFSSVFEVSDRPQVVSAEARFQFDRDRACALVRKELGTKPKRVAARAFPFPLDDKDLQPDVDVVRQLLADGAATVIRLPVRADISASRVEQTILETIRPEVLVFLPAVSALELRLRSTEQTWTRRHGERLGEGQVVHLDGAPTGESSWLVKKLSVRVSKDEAASVGEPAWEGVRVAEFTVGLPWNNGISGAERLSPVHVYFPTDETTGRSILLHGDFVIDSRRAQIQGKGPAGALNARFVDHAARGLADLAQAACPRYSRQVCAALAMSGSPSRFGNLVNKALVSALRDRRLLSGRSGRRALTVSEVRRITDLGAKWERRLTPLLARKTGLLGPGYSGERASMLLKELGLRTEAPAETASRVCVPKTLKRNAQALALLQEWAGEHSSWTRNGIYGALKEVRLLRDTDGQLRRADEVVLSVGGGPALPPTLRRRQLAPVSDPGARKLIQELDVEHLDAAGALDLLLEAIEERRYGRTPEEHRATLRFCRELCHSKRSVLRDASARLGVVRLPARRGGKRVSERPPPAEEWVPSSEVYLGSGWHPRGDLLERLYGPLNRAEFLAEQPPNDPPARRADQRFFTTLGAASDPREVPVSQRTTDRYREWISDPEVQEAWQCDDDHPTSTREVKATVLDRLDDLLSRVDSDGGALAEMLAELDAPYGADAQVRCQHRSHAGAAKARTAPGYQRWRLRQTAWVPVANDPQGRRHRVPSEAWTQVPRAASKLLIPQAKMPKARADLELVDWSKPGVSAVETLLTILRSVDADKRVEDTADRLLKKLDDLVPVKETRDPVSVLACRGRERSWSDSPLIPDLPRLDALDVIDVLPRGAWRGLRRAYGLRLASEIVEQKVHVIGPERTVSPLLPPRDRARLLALLAGGEEDPRRLARRLKKLREHPVTAFELRLSIDGIRRSTTRRTVHLDEKRSRQGDVTGGELYWTDAVRTAQSELVQVLGHYLQLGDHGRLGYFLAARHDALDSYGITQSEIKEATELLRRSTGPTNSPPASEVGEPPPEPKPPQQQAPPPQVDQAPPGHSTARAPSESAAAIRRPTARPVDHLRGPHAAALAPPPEEVTFGTPRQLEIVGVERGRDTRAAASTELAVAPTRDTHTAAETDRASAESANDITDADIEKLAVDYVSQYARMELEVVEICDVQAMKKGWDLEFVFADLVELVEVKGSRGSSAFAITRNEREQAQSHSDYVLYFVMDLTSARPRMIRIDDFGSKATDDRLVAHQWTVARWWEMSPVEIPIDPKVQAEAGPSSARTPRPARTSRRAGGRR